MAKVLLLLSSFLGVPSHNLSKLLNLEDKCTVQFTVYVVKNVLILAKPCFGEKYLFVRSIVQKLINFVLLMKKSI